MPSAIKLQLAQIAARSLHLLPPETAHHFATFCMKHLYVPDMRRNKPLPQLEQHLFNRDFPNPVGLAAGFDKNAEVPCALFKMGFGFVETGTVTMFPQKGNPKPRIFRLRKHRALINRMGFNNVGMEEFANNLEKYHLNRDCGRPIGINFGYKAGPDGVERQKQLTALAKRLSTFAQYGDYFVLNISCPNVKGGRAAQFNAELGEEVKLIRDFIDREAADANLLLKIGPDLNEEQLEALLKQIAGLNINGLIISNTLPNSPEAPHLEGQHSKEQGGLSGSPLTDMSTNLISAAYRITEGKLPIIGVGGIMTPEDAYAKIKAGASLVQLYTGFIYNGPKLVNDIKLHIRRELHKSGFNHISEAIGLDHKK